MVEPLPGHIFIIAAIFAIAALTLLISQVAGIFTA